MRVAVTDACIFIDLIELDLISVFFQLDVEMHTSVSVMNELYQDQKQILEAYQDVGKLKVHNLQEGDFLEMGKISFPRGLSIQDRTVIYLAKKLGSALVISSDKLVRDFASSQGLPFHGIFWILDQVMDGSLLSKSKVMSILSQMPNVNSLYQGVFMKKEIEKREKVWGE
jgi:predicted nucleic acid-binding protein